MKNKTIILLILLTTVFFIAFTSCFKPPYADINVGRFDGEWVRNSEAQEFVIPINVSKGDGFSITHLSYTNEVFGESFYITDLKNQQEIKAPWFELSVAEDMKSIKVKLNENITKDIREFWMKLDNDKNKAFVHVTITQHRKDMSY